MCVSYIFTKIYMYIHTHVFSSTLVVVGDLAPISDDISYYASELATSQFADVSLCLFVRVFCRHTVGVFDNHRHLCNLWVSTKVGLDKFFFFFRSPLFGPTLGQDLFPRTFLAILIIGLFRKQHWIDPSEASGSAPNFWAEREVALLISIFFDFFYIFEQPDPSQSSTWSWLKNRWEPFRPAAT